MESMASTVTKTILSRQVPRVFANTHRWVLLLQTQSRHYGQPSAQEKIPIAAIKALRGRSGAPIKAVKDALVANNGDPEAAMEHLRKLGAALAADRAHRHANDGLVALAQTPDLTTAAAIHLSSETDFVARTPQFSDLAIKLSQAAIRATPAEVAASHSLSADDVLAVDGCADALSEAAAALGENIVLRSAIVMHAPKNGVVCGYIHRAVGEHCGKIGVLAALTGTAGNLRKAGRRLAMHIAAAAPQFRSIPDVPQTRIEREREIFVEAAMLGDRESAKPKPPEVLVKIAEGRLRKWYGEVVLSEQEMMVEAEGYSGKARSVLKSLRAEVDAATITDFARFVVGEEALEK